MLASDRVVLPVGIRKNGAVYRNVRIDQMRAADQSHMSDKKLRNNGGAQSTMLLRRCVQEIEGLVSKARPLDLLDAELIRGMTQVDRDYLLVAIRALEGKTQNNFSTTCPHCRHKEDHTVDLAELGESEWPDEEPTEVWVELPHGLRNASGELCTRMRWRFMTGSQQESIGSQPPARQLTSLIASSCLELMGFGRPLTTADAEMMLTADLTAVEEQVGQMMPGLDVLYKVTCENCGGEHTHVLDLTNFLSSTTPKTSSSTAKVRRPR